MRYTYLGDKMTDPKLVGMQCDPVRRLDGKCVVSTKMATALVIDSDGCRHVVLRRRLRLNKNKNGPLGAETNGPYAETRNAKDCKVVKLKKQVIVTENIPDELKNTNHWLLWRFGTEKNGRIAKVPKRANRRNASTSNPATWDTFDNVMAAYEDSDFFSGIGFVMDGTYVGLDIDCCLKRDKTPYPWVYDSLTRLDSYAEISPSGGGIKIFAKVDGVPFDGAKKAIPDDLVRQIVGKQWRKSSTHDKPEFLFMAEGYFAVTGQVVERYTELRERTEAYAVWYSKLMGKETTVTKPPAVATTKTNGKLVNLSAEKIAANDRRKRAMDAAEKVEIPATENDGSRRMVKVLRQFKRYGFDEHESIDLFREYEDERPFNVDWDDEKLIKEWHRCRVEQGEALDNLKTNGQAKSRQSTEASKAAQEQLAESKSKEPPPPGSNETPVDDDGLVSELKTPKDVDCYATAVKKMLKVKTPKKEDDDGFSRAMKYVFLGRGCGLAFNRTMAALGEVFETKSLPVAAEGQPEAWWRTHYSKSDVAPFSLLGANSEMANAIVVADPKEMLAEMDPQIVQAAREFLENPSLDEIVEDAKRLGIAGEENNIKLFYLCGTSRLLTDPIGIIVKGESESGKTTPIMKVAEMFPPEVMSSVTSMSPMSLYYAGADSLKHRFIVKGERSRQTDAKSQDLTAPMRQLYSEKVIERWTVQPTGPGGSMQNQALRVEGPIAYIETTTLEDIFNEDATRAFKTYADDSDEQTERIKLKKAERAMDPERAIDDREQILAKHHAIQRLLDPYLIRIPYAKQLARDTPHELRMRRGFDRLLATIEAVTLLNQRNRKGRNGKVIEATASDYEVAHEIVGTLIEADLPDNLDASSKKAYHGIERLAMKSGANLEGFEFTREELEVELGLKKAQTCRLLKALAAKGVVTPFGRHKKYAVEHTMDLIDGVLPARVRGKKDR